MESIYRINRVVPAGSVGKQTDIKGSDLDYVMFINNQEPPFVGILTDFQNILRNHPKIGQLYQIKKTQHSLQFQGSGFKMDLVLAPNYKTGRKTQRKGTLERIRESPSKNAYRFSAALAETSVYFLNRQSFFVKDIARIAKFWYKSLNMPYISGASTFIELVAVDAARQRGSAQHRRNTRFNGHLKVFLRFLKLLIDFEKLDLVFNLGLFNDHEVIDKIPPRVIEPSNPYNNLVHNWSNELQSLIAQRAQDTYNQFESWIVNPTDIAEKDFIPLIFGSNYY